MRDHNSHWLLTQIYHESIPPKPALNGEPYYVGYPPDTPVRPDSAEADLYNRSGMYGSFLSGGFAGHIYGAVGLWGGDVESAADYAIWDAIGWKSGNEMRHLVTFAMSEGLRYRDLIPNADLLCPNKNHRTDGNCGWAYCARSPQKDLFLLYFEADCPPAVLRGVLFERDYFAVWFDPRDGRWIEAGILSSTSLCEIQLPAFPSDSDWAMKLSLQG